MAKPKKIEIIEVDHLDSWMSSTGFLFPSNELELDRFNKLFDDYYYKLDKTSIDPIAIINNTFKRQSKVMNMFDKGCKKLFIMNSQHLHQISNITEDCL